MRDFLQQLRHVRQVGHVPLAVLPGQHAVAHAAQLRGFEDGRHPALAGVLGPLPQRVGDPIGQRITARRQEFPRSRRRTSSPRRRAPARAVRLVERLQQAQPVIGRLRAEHVGVAGIDRRNAGVAQRVKQARASLCCSTMTAMSRARAACRRRWRRWPAARRCRRPGRRRCVRAARRSAGSEFRCGPTSVVCTTRSRNGSLCGAPASRCPWWWASTSSDHDGGVAELGAAQHHLQAVDQRRVAAPVGAEGVLVAGGLGRLQVGDDVAAAERVDGLLRVADQDQRGVAAERAVDHLPLHRVGVLELVDHDDRPALVHPRRGGGVVGVQRVGEPAQQVVVAEDAQPPLAAFQLGQNVFREVDPDRGLANRVRVARPQLGRTGC